MTRQGSRSLREIADLKLRGLRQPAYLLPAQTQRKIAISFQASQMEELHDMATDEKTLSLNIPRDGLIAMMQTQLTTLQSIKAGEMQWIQFYTILTAPAIGFLIAGAPCKVAPILPYIIPAYLVVTGWFQYVLMKERHSYYGVLRSVVRAENLLGLSGFLAPNFANSAFPKGLGPDKEKDGTQPCSSFLARQIYVFVFFFGLAGASAYQAHNGWVLIYVAFDLVWVAIIFCWDQKALRRQTLEEKGLSGSDPAWFREDAKAK
jgi:hypothetical protein